MTIPSDLGRFESLISIISHLRSPQGCPWDRKQTHRSLREHLLEETYEVLEALDEGSKEKLCVELGDLLMQIVMHAQLADEAGDFSIGDVVAGINRKLISRHPHVFGSNPSLKDQADQGPSTLTAEEVLVRWEELKKQERHGQGGLLSSVPRVLPALAYSQSVQERVARVGFDWPEDRGVLEKLAEEVAEFKEAATPENRAAEFGDILFTLANYARRQGIDLETALREANAKFCRRFSHLEELADKQGLELARLTLDEMNRLWNEVKQNEPAP